ncbi:hypothetical protein [Shewanella marina]|uniref:hypothetical protein n=1 Tax=Shewanella marina TaxID=487319 RepID=UPI000472CF6A|nr:hypothetical protein [Shewanella marina]
MKDIVDDCRESWKYRLAIELMLAGISSLKREYSDLFLIRMKAHEKLSSQECLSFLISKIDSLQGWMEYITDIYERDLNDSWGGDGKPGQRENIEVACSKLIAALRALYDWELSIAMLVPDVSWVPVFTKLQLSSLSLIEDTEAFFYEFEKLLDNPNIVGKHTLIFEFNFPYKLKGIENDVKKAQKLSITESKMSRAWDDIWIELLKKFIVG